MLNRKRHKYLENPRGIGDVYKGDEKIAKVSYNIDVQQEMLLTGNDEIEGLKSMSGSISLIEGEKVLWGIDKLVLHMQDGRKIDFFVKSANLPGSDYEIQPTGGFY